MNNLPAHIAIVMVNWNGARDTIECLESLLLLKHDRHAIVIVDNASTDDSVAQIRDWAQSQNTYRYSELSPEDSDHEFGFLQSRGLYVILCQENGGFARACNIGLEKAAKSASEFVWLLNNDTVVAADSLSFLEKRMNEFPDIGICGSLLIYYDERDRIQALGGVNYNVITAKGHPLLVGRSITALDNIDDKCLSPDYISGASMLVRMDLFRDIGGMNEKYFLYFEELDWAWRYSSKWRNGVCKDSVVFHKVGSTIGTARRSPLSQYYQIRNLFLVYWINKPIFIIFPLVRSLIELAYTVAKRRDLLWTTVVAIADGLMSRYGPRVQITRE